MRNGRAVSVAVLLFLMQAHLVAAPVVFRVSDPIGPGETALLFGDGIGAQVSAEGWRVDDEQVSGPPATAQNDVSAQHAVPLQVLQASDVCAKVVIPADWKPGLYIIRLKNDSGQSSPASWGVLNRTEPWWWLGGENDTAFAGEEIRVFGKNLGEKTTAWLAADEKAVALPVVKAEPYAARFTVPPDLAPGEYTLWVHNGFGGGVGFGALSKVKVEQRTPWPAQQHNVKDSGAIGDGVADDTSAFEAALAAAQKNGGGIVFVPRGTYKITGKLVVPAKTVLRGEKRESVWLYVPKELPEFETVIAGNGDFAVEDLSMVSQAARRLIACPDFKSVYNMPWGQSPPPDMRGHNAALRNLRLHHLRYAHRIQGKEDPRRAEEVGPSTVVLCGPDMELSDCEVVSSGMPIVLMDARHCRIERNRLDTGRNGWYGLWTVEESVMERNTIQARDLEGSYGGVQGKAYRLYIAGNTWRDAYGDEREALTFDTPYGCTWMGKAANVPRTESVRGVQGATLTAVDKKWTPGALKGQLCMIIYGKGMGQWIPIVDNTETTITLEHPWAVPPDDTSHVVVKVNKSDVVITNNSFSDASVATQLYANCSAFIIDGNKSVRTGGMYGLGWDYMRRNVRTYSACCFNQWLNNDLSEGFIYQQGAFLHGVLGPTSSGGALEPPAITTIGNIIRNNTLRDHNTAGAMYFGPHPLTPPKTITNCVGRDTIIEGNTIRDSPLAIDVYPLYVDTLVRNNRVERCTVPLRDDGTNTCIHPAARLGYQVQAVKALLAGKGNLDAMQKAVAEMEAQPVTPELSAKCAELRAQLWAQVARCQPETTPDMLAVLVGLRYEFASSSPILGTLTSGKGGQSQVAVRVRTEPWAPEVQVKGEVALPVGWLAVGTDEPLSLKPNVVETIKCNLKVPAASDVRAIAFRLKVALGDATLTVPDRFDVGRRDVVHWMAVGPFPNKSGKLPDSEIYPPENRIDLNAEYDGIGGKVRWQAASLPNKYLHLDQMYKPAEGATAYAVTSLRADEDTKATLNLSCRGSLAAWLNDSPIATIAGPDGGSKAVRVQLKKGDNILLCKSSTKGGKWEIAADVAEEGPGDHARVRQTPATELKNIPVLVPVVLTPTALTPQAGPVLEHAADVVWRQVFADDFDRLTIGDKLRVAAGTWDVKKGVLRGGERSLISYVDKVRAPVRIEYDARSVAPHDLSCSWLLEPEDLNSGYLIAFAAGESGSRVQVEGSLVASSDAPVAKAEPNKWYHVIAQVLPNGNAQLFANGKLVLEARPGVAPRRALYPGLWTWGGGEFAHVRIYAGQWP